MPTRKPLLNNETSSTFSTLHRLPAFHHHGTTSRLAFPRFALSHLERHAHRYGDVIVTSMRKWPYLLFVVDLRRLHAARPLRHGVLPLVKEKTDGAQELQNGT